MSDVLLKSYANRLDEAERDGRLLYKDNDNYKTLVNCLEYPEFRKLFKEHFKSWDRIKTIVMFMKLYIEIEKASPVKITGYQKISIMDKIIKDSDLRRDICDRVIKWMNNGTFIESCNKTLIE